MVFRKPCQFVYRVIVGSSWQIRLVDRSSAGVVFEFLICVSFGYVSRSCFLL